MWGHDNKHKRVLAYLYEFRSTPSEPPDLRISLAGIADALEMPTDDVSAILEKLKEQAYIRCWKVGRMKFHKLTPFGMAELQKQTEHWMRGEVSTSRVGLEIGKKATIG